MPTQKTNGVYPLNNAMWEMIIYINYTYSQFERKSSRTKYIFSTMKWDLLKFNADFAYNYFHEFII